MIGIILTQPKNYKPNKNVTNYKNSQKTSQQLYVAPCSSFTTTKLHSTKPELRFCAGSNPACRMLEVCNGGNLTVFQYFMTQYFRY